jgi:hypothetical protein
MATVLSYNDNRGGMAYPFLPADWRWSILSHPLKDRDAVDALLDGVVATPTLRWVKDDKTLDLRVPGLDTAAFLQKTGLELSMAKGGYVLSKRISRVMRPYRYWAFFDQADVRIDYNELLDGRLWDGCGLVSAAFVQRLADSLDLSDRDRRELLRSGRLEVTALHNGGQDKGHVLVVNDLAVDFMFPAHSAKTELRLTDGRVFVGLQPVHSADEACLDVQSVINLYPFLKPEQLLYWMQLESALFLDGIRSGRVGGLLGRLAQAESEAEMDSFSDWHVGDYLLSGGQPLWFAGMVKASPGSICCASAAGPKSCERPPRPVVTTSSRRPSATVRWLPVKLNSTRTRPPPGSTTRIGSITSWTSWAAATATTPSGFSPLPTMTAASGFWPGVPPTS